MYYKNVTTSQELYYKTNFIISNKDFPLYAKYMNNQKFDIYYDNKNSIENDLFKMNS
ncbi:hypothetical protein HOB94_01165 [bacterium]|nr:hypothetical protein [bacterium]MBT4632617.1 hypothetical protein [bacterium]